MLQCAYDENFSGMRYAIDNYDEVIYEKEEVHFAMADLRLSDVLGVGDASTTRSRRYY